MFSRSWDEGEMCVYSAVRMLYFLRLNREMSHPRRQFLEERLHKPSFASTVRCSRASTVQLRLLVKGHPVQEPRVRVILDVDLDVNQQASAEESRTVPETFLSEAQSCS